eukprot:TRINITY_DN20452_c0_g1_i1.p1 TRINITY_DN20452_c0_g1~~TRINITY_DN20452_c0_g1_i1.p1  ORF type:complete len:518 (+),score=87.26 TRINITY_DN20452_c0_g1_i1:68-1621(+)
MGCGASTTRAAPTGGPQLETYPLQVGAEIQSLVLAAGLYGAGDASQMAEVDESYDIIKASDLSDDACDKIKRMALIAGEAANAEILQGGSGASQKIESISDGSLPPPDGISANLWKRTRELCLASGRWACAAKNEDLAREAKEQKAFNRHARAIKGFGPGKGPKDPETFAQRANDVMPANVIMFSGCKDSQTSADVFNTASFGLPEDAGPGGAGGACTSAMIKSLSEQPTNTWVGLLKSMQGILAGKYTQIPQLSSSKSLDLKAPFSVLNDEPSGRCRALLVGINYPGTKAELKGCHNDVETMKRYLLENGYAEDDMRILLDDGEHDDPTGKAMMDGMSWLVEGAEKGDSLFFHYSGHGASVKDDEGDEADGKDEALCPCDYATQGLLRDDDAFKFLVGPLKDGVRLTCVLDCCHSGSILDLPYMFKGDNASIAEAEEGKITSMKPNPGFDFGKILQVMKDHPLLFAGAAVAGGAALLFMGKENRSKALTMATGAMGAKGVDLSNPASMLTLAKGFM